MNEGFFLCNAKISKVKQELRRVKRIINDHQETEKEKVEIFLENLRQERQLVEDIRHEQRLFMQNNNTVEIVKNRDERIAQMELITTPYQPTIHMNDISSVTGEFFIQFHIHEYMWSGVYPWILKL